MKDEKNKKETGAEYDFSGATFDNVTFGGKDAVRGKVIEGDKVVDKRRR